MRNALVGTLVVVGMAVGAGSAGAVPIVPAGAVWEYTTTNPGPGLAWTTASGGWSSDTAPFGNCANASSQGGGCGSYTRDFDDPDMRWAADGPDGDDFWVRTTFDTTGYDLTSIVWNLGVDNGYTLYLNGTFISSGNAEFYTSRWEYSGNFGGNLVVGTNYLAVALEDHGGLTAFDMEVVGNPVPEPGTLLLLGSGIASLAMRRRRRA